MNRRTAALAIREAFAAEGVTVITHDQWDSIVNWSNSPDSTAINMSRYSVLHHTGGSALLAELQRLVDQGHDPLTVGMNQMANVDHYHYWVRGWRGFAYCGACLPWRVGGRLVWLEGRSAWISHGAHLNDPAKVDWPTYYMIGAADTAVSEAQKDFVPVQNRVLRSVFGWQPSRYNQKKHREVQGVDTTRCCDPTLGAFLVEFRDKEYYMNIIETYGDNRHGTFAEMALKHFPRGATPKVNIAAGDAYSDLSAATAAAAAEGVPVLTVERTGNIPSETEAALIALGAETAEVFGGPAAIDGGVRDRLRAINA